MSTDDTPVTSDEDLDAAGITTEELTEEELAGILDEAMEVDNEIDGTFAGMPEEKVKEYKKRVTYNNSLAVHLGRRHEVSPKPEAIENIRQNAFFTFMLPHGSEIRLDFEIYFQKKVGELLKEIKSQVSAGAKPDDEAPAIGDLLSLPPGAAEAFEARKAQGADS